jgi:hypothetical protein
LSQRPPHNLPPLSAKSNTTLVIAIVVIVIVVVAVVGTLAAFVFYNFATSSASTLRTPHSAKIVNGLIIVSSAGYYQYKFTVPAGARSASVNGSFTASGQYGNTI